MSQTAERYDDINTSSVAVVGFISAIAIFAIIVAVQTLYFNRMETLEQRKAGQQNPEAANLIAEQEGRLARKGWINRETGVVAVPIERAMKLVVEEMQAEQQALEPNRET